MGELGGFLRIHRVGFDKRDPRERIHDYKQYFALQPEDELRRQGGRCMDCGVPFCHEGCPLGNLIPDWNDLVYRGDWRAAIEQLHATNNFPEFTGLICPAPCESACVLDINDDPVAIEQIELGIAERAWQEGWIVPEPPEDRTGRSVAVVGSGPAGLAVAAELNKLGHEVTVYERDEGVGGLMRFGVPDAKLEKWIIDRRAAVLEQEGVRFECNVDVGTDVTAAELRERFDAVVLAIGSRVHRDLEVPGRELDGVHFAMDYLYQRNRHVARLEGRPSREPEQPIVAEGKHVVVVGGGDTGMDCISNAIREGALDVKMLDVYPELPASGRPTNTPWPLPPKRTLTTYALDEGGQREWNAEVNALEGRDGRVTTVHARRVEGTSSRDLRPVPGSEHTLPADLVLIAIGFAHPEQEGPIAQLGLDLDARGNVKAPVYGTSLDGVFACGDARVGQSLVVTAIAEGRKCARLVDRQLGGGDGRAIQAESADAHFIEAEAQTAGTITTAHRVVGDQ
ncbi:MAG TPA: glutamate synthase subunit beta [Solirubrobacteraceae bacterium]|nr:glutamate synthase subunit beta [Solirubrobacteraceae bacterium]